MADAPGVADLTTTAPATPPAGDVAPTTPEGTAPVKPPVPPAEPAKPPESVPATYADFTVPEGFTIDKAALAEFVPVAKELKLTQGQAQKIADLYAKQVNGLLEQQKQEWGKQIAAWGDAAAKDTEIGGQGFEANVKLARAALEKFGTKELAALIDDMGLGNHPEYIRFAYRVGKAIGEDRLIHPSAPGSRDQAGGSDAEIGAKWYPNSQKPSGS